MTSTAFYRLLPPFAALSLACATLGRLSFTEPEVALQEIAVTGVGLTGGTFDLVFDVYNPNDYRIRSTRLEVGIDLEGRHFGDALLEAGVGAGAKALVTRQAVGYGLTGRVLVDTPLGERTVALKGTGTVPLRKLLK